MSFQDLDEFFDSTLRLPVRGKIYVIDSPDAETGLFCQRLIETAVRAKNGAEITDEEAEKLVLSDEDEVGLYERLLSRRDPETGEMDLGAVHREMVADKVPWEHLKHCGITTLMWAAGNVEAAEKYWAAGGQAPKAERPKPQDRKPAKKSAARPASRGGSTNRPQTVKGTVLSPGETS